MSRSCSNYKNIIESYINDSGSTLPILFPSLIDEMVKFAEKTAGGFDYEKHSYKEPPVGKGNLYGAYDPVTHEVNTLDSILVISVDLEKNTAWCRSREQNNFTKDIDELSRYYKYIGSVSLK